MTYQMLPPLSSNLLTIPNFFFSLLSFFLFLEKAQSAHPLACPPPGLAVGKPGPPQSQGCYVKHVWIPITRGEVVHKLGDTVSKAVRDKLSLFPEPVIGKKDDSKMSSDTPVSP